MIEPRVALLRHLLGMVHKCFKPFMIDDLLCGTSHLSVLKVFSARPEEHLCTVAAYEDGSVLCEQMRDTETREFVGGKVPKLSVELEDPTSIDQIIRWLNSIGVSNADTKSS